MNDEDLKESIWNEKHQLKMISDYGLQLIIDKVRNHDKIQVNNMLKSNERLYPLVLFIIANLII